MPRLASLSAEAREALAQQLVARTFVAGQMVCVEGEPGDYVYFLQTGWAKAVRSATDGREQVTLLLHDGDWFGAEAVFAGKAYALTVVALEQVTVWAVDGAMLAALARRYPALASICLEHLGTQVLYYIQLIEDLGLRSVQARIAYTLLNHAELQDGRWVVPRRDWATLDEMAARLGTVRDVLSRALNGLQREGLLRLERRQIILLDPKKLLERGSV